MPRFSDIPTEQFPLDFKKYCRLRDDIYGAANGFSELGTSAGDMVCRELIEVHTRLGQVWELIRGVERGKNTDVIQV